ncbi:MAG TPA: ABC transporter substrate-binding protein [Actinomycetes bacterium]|jgi:branched-chain amino acid transport system substrate-binding protein|nr:ABC transporter substrate-binding protein [Actinomycetes bacterium]
MAILRVVLVTPLTGPLARFGRAGATALDVWARQAARLPAGWRDVTLEVHDAHPDPAGAMRASTASHPDVVFGPYGSSPAAAAAATTDRLVWNHGGATSELVRARFPRVVNVPSPASTYFRGTLRAIRAADPGARTVALLHGETGFARDVAGGARVAATALAFEVRAVGFPPGQAADAAARLPDAEVLLVVGSFEDEIAAARVLLRRRWRAAAFVAAGVEEVLAPLGAQRDGLLGPAQWVAAAAPEPDEGPDAAWFVDAFRRATGEEPAYPAVQAFAAGVLSARCLREAGTTDDAAQLAAAGRLSCRTLYGGFRLDPVTGLQAGHEVLTVQWRGGSRRVVWPLELAELPISYPLSRSMRGPA